MSPSSRRAWIEMFCALAMRRRVAVALLAEGVDRNSAARAMAVASVRSPSSRRAWIEIPSLRYRAATADVALLAEGVDRNSVYYTACVWLCRRPPRGGRG